MKTFLHRLIGSQMLSVVVLLALTHCSKKGVSSRISIDASEKIQEQAATDRKNQLGHFGQESGVVQREQSYEFQKDGTKAGVAKGTFDEVVSLSIAPTDLSSLSSSVTLSHPKSLRVTGSDGQHIDVPSKPIVVTEEFATPASGEVAVMVFDEYGNVETLLGSKLSVTDLRNGRSVVKFSLYKTNVTFVVATLLVPSNPPKLVSLDITPKSLPLAKGTQRRYTATATYSDYSSKNVTSQVAWYTTTPDMLLLGVSPGDKGLLTGKSVGDGSIVIEMDGISASLDQAVSAALLTEIQVTATQATVAKGSALQFSATGVFSDNTTQDLTLTAMWGSSSSATATVGNASGNKGLVTGVNLGTTSISATSGGISGSTPLQITDAVLTSIQITPSSGSIPIGIATDLVATGIYSDGSNQNITALATWSSSDATVATVATAGGAVHGRVSASSTGTSQILASYGGHVSNASSITVINATLVSIDVTPSLPSIALGTSQAFVATGNYSDNSTHVITNSVVWASSNSSKATISNADGSHGITTTASIGSTTISATFSGVSGSTTLAVTSALLTSISVAPSSPSVALGLTRTFTATGHYTDGTSQDITNSVTWSSADTAVSTISNAGGTNGVASTLSVGSTNIIATLASASGNATLTVTSAALMSIVVTPANPAIAKGQSKTFIATGTFTNNTTSNLTTQVTWESQNTNTATISNVDGSRGVASSVEVGNSVVTATYGSVVGQTTLAVNAAALVSIALLPTSASFILGSGLTQAFTASGTYSDGTVYDITSSVGWSSSDGSIVDINLSGVSIALSAGSASISASLNGISSSNSSVTVAAPTSTPTASSTATATSTYTATNTPANTATPTFTATNTFASTNTPTNTSTSTNTPTDTAAPTATNTSTNTPVPPTNTATNTSTNTATNTPTSTATNTPTNTATNSATNTPTSTIVPPTNTPTNTPTETPTNTTVASNDHDPVLTVSSVTVGEGIPTTAAVLQATATDLDSGTTFTYSLTGADAAKFTLNASTGVLKFVTSPDYESADDSGANHIYDLTVTVSDNGSPARTASTSITVTVTDVVEQTSDGIVRFDFETSTASLPTNYVVVKTTTAYSAAAAYGWVTAATSSYDKGSSAMTSGYTVASGTEGTALTNLIRDANTGTQAAPGTFQANLVPSTSYEVTMIYGDSTAHDNMKFELLSGYSSVTGTGWSGSSISGLSNLASSAGVRPGGWVDIHFTVVTDVTGRLQMKMSDTGGSNDGWVISSLNFVPTASFTTLTITPPTNPTADAAITDNFVVSNYIAGAVYNLTNTLGTGPTDIDSRFSNTQVQAPTSGVWNVAIRRPYLTTAQSSTVSLVEVTGRSSGSTSVTYTPDTTTRRIDFGHVSNPLTATNYTPIYAANIYSSTVGYGWSSAATATYRSYDANYPTSPAAELLQDFHSGSSSNVFSVNVPLPSSGTYNYTITIYCYDYSAGSTISMSVTAESAELGGSAPTTGSFSVAPNTLVSKTLIVHSTDVSADGKLDLTFAKVSGSYFFVNGIDVAIAP